MTIKKEHDPWWWASIAIITGIAVAAVLLLTSAANAQTGLEIPIDQVYRGDPGEIIVIAEIAATNEGGWTCGAFLERFNNSSIHAEDGHPEHGTNLIITSGANGTTFSDIESVSFDEAIKSFVIDGDIAVGIQIGEDKVASMGFNLSFECIPPSVTSTTTTTAPPPGTTTTTEPAPINGVDTGGGALEHLVTSDPTPDPLLSPLGTWLAIVGFGALTIGAAWFITRALWRRS